MFERILMPTDGSEASLAAIQYGLGLAKQFQSQVSFLYVLDISLYAWGAEGVYWPDLIKDLEGVAQEALTKAKALADKAGIASEGKLVQDHPTHAILEEAKNHDLTVMGTHGRGGIEKLLLGSVAQGVAQRTQYPLLVVRPGEVWNSGPHTILVPTDGSESSQAATLQALELAKVLGAKINFLFVLQTPGFVYLGAENPYYANDLYDELQALGHNTLDKAMLLAQQAGIAAEKKLAEDHPVETILKEAQSNDLIVMGTHGRGGLEKVIMGSVAQGVIQRSHRPVLVVHSHPKG